MLTRTLRWLAAGARPKPPIPHGEEGIRLVGHRAYVRAPDHITSPLQLQTTDNGGAQRSPLGIELHVQRLAPEAALSELQPRRGP